MPIYLDRHHLAGMTAADVAEAHRKDLELQDRYGVRFVTYWFDAARGTGFCLIEAPDVQTAMRVHDEAHGDVATHVIEVDLSAVEAFLGRIADPQPRQPNAEPIHEPALRGVMFTDIVGSTAMTERLGDARAVEMIRAHDGLVRRALEDHRGREVKHTGDGIMASFGDVTDAVAGACSIQHAFERFNLASREPLRVRIGIHAGDPVEDSNDLFGTTVQLAARLCQSAKPDSIAVSRVVRDLAGGQFAFSDLGPRSFKGFAEAFEVFEVGWRPGIAAER